MNQRKTREKLSWIRIDALVALKRNPQYCTPAQMDSLKSSIQRDGFAAPILVRPLKTRGKFEIISGNHRVMAAREIGLTNIPCIIMSMDKKTAQRLAVNLNTIHGEPNPELLAPYLGEMDDEVLREIHIEKKMLEMLLAFDETLEKRLAELQPPDSLNRDSSLSPIKKCICPQCGREHIEAHEK